MTKIDFIITVPAMWSDAAKKKTEDAAIRAGMGNEHGLELLSEPESAAVYTIKNMDSTHSQIKVNDRIVVCDAGGGTVDLISYDIRSTHPSLSVMECAAGTGEYVRTVLYGDTKDERKGTIAAQHSSTESLRNFSSIGWVLTIARYPLYTDNRWSRISNSQKLPSEMMLPNQCSMLTYLQSILSRLPELMVASSKSVAKR